MKLAGYVITAIVVGLSGPAFAQGSGQTTATNAPATQAANRPAPQATRPRVDQPP